MIKLIKTKILTIRVTDKFHANLKMMAAKNGLFLGEYLELLLGSAINKEKE